jgi:uncharacterized membrane protein
MSQPESDQGAFPATKAGAEQSISVTVAQKQLSASSFSGPLPPPHTLSEYESVFPGCAERIVAMAERQSSHRQQLENSRIEASNRTEHRGQIFAFIIALAAILGGVYLISIGKDASGLTAIIAALGSLVDAFVYGKYTQAREREQKRQPFQKTEGTRRQLELFDRDSSGSS